MGPSTCVGVTEGCRWIHGIFGPESFLISSWCFRIYIIHHMFFTWGGCWVLDCSSNCWDIIHIYRENSSKYLVIWTHPSSTLLGTGKNCKESHAHGLFDPVKKRNLYFSEWLVKVEEFLYWIDANSFLPLECVTGKNWSACKKCHQFLPKLKFWSTFPTDPPFQKCHHVTTFVTCTKSTKKVSNL